MSRAAARARRAMTYMKASSSWTSLRPYDIPKFPLEPYGGSPLGGQYSSGRKGRNRFRARSCFTGTITFLRERHDFTISQVSDCDSVSGRLQQRFPAGVSKQTGQHGGAAG